MDFLSPAGFLTHVGTQLGLEIDVVNEAMFIS